MNKKMQEQIASLMANSNLSTNGIKEIPEKEKDEESKLESLKAQYEAKFGKKPHHLWKEKKLTEKLAEQL